MPDYPDLGDYPPAEKIEVPKIFNLPSAMNKMKRRPPPKGFPSISDNQLEFTRIHEGAQRFNGMIELVKTLIKWGGLCFLVWLIFDGLKPLMAREASAIEAFGGLIKALQLHQIVLIVWGGAATAAWLVERRRTKRALAKKSEMQKRLESSDANRTSSHNPL